jgi:hypothetical protein
MSLLPFARHHAVPQPILSTLSTSGGLLTQELETLKLLERDDGSIMTPSRDTRAGAYRRVVEELYVRAFNDPFEVSPASASEPGKSVRPPL